MRVLRGDDREQAHLPIVLAAIGLVAVITGARGLLAGVGDEFYAVKVSHIPGNTILDSNLRYFSGLWIGLGLIILSRIVPSRERQCVALTFVSVPIFLGGIGRVVSMALFGVPPIPFIVFTVLELLFPLFILWWKKLSF